MIESVFVFMAAIAFVTFVLGIEQKSIVYSAMSVALWVLVMLDALYIEVPTVTDTYTEYGFSAFCLAFIFANIVWLVYLFSEWRKGRKGRPPVGS